MQPRFNQLPNLTSENKERQPCWRVPSRRHHVSDPRLIKHTGGILYKHLKAECYIPVVTAMACNKRTQDNDVQAHIQKAQTPANTPCAHIETLSSEAEFNLSSIQ